MSSNPYVNIRSLTIDVAELDDSILEKAVFAQKEYDLFEVPLLFIYKNVTTGTFAEFELADVPPESSAEEAIELFMQRVKSEGVKALPKELLALLTDAELELFTLASFNEECYTKIEESLYIQTRDSYYYDKYGFRYIVAGVGIKDAVLCYEQQDGRLLILHTAPQQLLRQGERLCVRDVEDF